MSEVKSDVFADKELVVGGRVLKSRLVVGRVSMRTMSRCRMRLR